MVSPKKAVSGNQRLQAPYELMPVDLIGNHHCDQLADSGQKQVGMERLLVLGSSAGHTEAVLEVVDGFLHIDTDLIGILPFLRASCGAWVGAQVLFRVDVDHAPAGRLRAGILAVADAPGFLCFGIVLPLHLWTDELHGGEAAAQMGFTALSLHGEGRVMWTAGDAVFIKGAVGIFQGEPAVEWDESLFEMELVEEVMVDLYGVKGGVPQEGLWVDKRVHAEEVLQDGDEGLGIGKGLVLVRGIGFLFYNDIRVCLEEVLVVKGDVADNAQAVGHETELVGIAEMPVDVHLLDGRVGFGMGRQGSIGGLVRVIGIIKPLCFFECLELFDDAVGVFGIIFRHPCLDAGGVKNGHGGKGGINVLADWLRQIHKIVEHGLQVREEILLEPRELGGVRDDAEAAEVPQLLGILQEHDQKRVGRDGKDALQQKGFEHGIEQVLARPAGKGMEMCHKRDGDNLVHVYGLIKHDEELVFIVVKFFLAICKNIFQGKLFVCYHIGSNSFTD